MTKITDSLNTTIDLDTPVKRGETTIDKVVLRKPTSGELRGVNLVDVMQMEVNTVQKLIPRISDPSLTDAEMSQLDPADTFQMGAAITSFLLPKAMK